MESSNMPTIAQVCEFLENFAPSSLAEDWDNVGLLVGDRERTVERIMTCLTITPESAAEACAERADLIIAHHPLPFRPLKRLTTDTTVGRILLDLIRANVAIYSPHTAFDSASAGINQRLAEGLGLTEIAPLIPIDGDADNLGAGRFGCLSKESTISEVANTLKVFLRVDSLHCVGKFESTVRKVAVACGSAGQFLEPAQELGCDLLVTGETNFHTCLEAESTGVALLLPGHYASERFAVEHLADVIASEFNELSVWPSHRETDPLRWF